jgi:phosphoglycerate dehydrogenase-like enzyme
MSSFRVGITRDFLNREGRLGFGDIDIGLGLLDEAGIAHEFLAEDAAELRPDQVAGYDGLLVLAPRITRATLEGADRLAVVARFGVGYDSVDVAACTGRGIAVTITPDGVRRPVAVAALTFLLALAHRLPDKDRLTRERRWDEKLAYMGTGTTGRTLGVIGLGNIGRELCRVVAPLDMRLLAHDPYVPAEVAAPLGVELVELEALLTQADFVTVCCTLTPETRHLIDARRLSLMKPSAFLINVARGPIVDTAALADALRRHRIRGAGIDVFEVEPPPPDDELLGLDNVILSPHAMCWTDECFTGNGTSACRSMVAVARGDAPRDLVDRAVLDSPAFRSKLETYRREKGANR